MGCQKEPQEDGLGVEGGMVGNTGGEVGSIPPNSTFVPPYQIPQAPTSYFVKVPQYFQNSLVGERGGRPILEQTKIKAGNFWKLSYENKSSFFG